ncbi:hypothetical protein [Bradyrhizobium sp.]|uniref:hypothetical protein n=1 Tax=Bradyrhizobium sp. TaxID=376 RepID=UPI002E0A6918|nr:hypothetical protein [Bradyrhizobium sp.]
MQKIGLIAATIIAFSFGPIEAWAQMPKLKPLNGAAYEEAVCRCRNTASVKGQGTPRWAECMGRRDFKQLGPDGKPVDIPPNAGDWVKCKKKG